MNADVAWSQRVWEPLGIRVGPAAWRLSTLAGADAAYIAEHPSLLVIAPDDEDALLRQAAAVLRSLPPMPVMLGVREPEFSRRLPDLLRRRLELLGLPRVDIVTMWLQETAELKGGGSLQHLFELRRAGLFDHLGLGHTDVRSVEWLAFNTAAHLLAAPYSLHDQAARYRALTAAQEYGMACLAFNPDEPAELAGEALRFAIAEAQRALPVLEAPLPPEFSPMPVDEVEAAWRRYQGSHAEPAPLPRARPPE